MSDLNAYELPDGWSVEDFDPDAPTGHETCDGDEED